MEEVHVWSRLKNTTFCAIAHIVPFFPKRSHFFKMRHGKNVAMCLHEKSSQNRMILKQNNKPIWAPDQLFVYFLCWHSADCLRFCTFFPLPHYFLFFLYKMFCLISRTYKSGLTCFPKIMFFGKLWWWSIFLNLQGVNKKMAPLLYKFTLF